MKKSTRKAAGIGVAAKKVEKLAKEAAAKEAAKKEATAQSASAPAVSLPIVPRAARPPTQTWRRKRLR